MVMVPYSSSINCIRNADGKGHACEKSVASTIKCEHSDFSMIIHN